MDERPTAGLFRYNGRELCGQCGAQAYVTFVADFESEPHTKKQMAVPWLKPMNHSVKKVQHPEKKLRRLQNWSHEEGNWSLPVLIAKSCKKAGGLTIMAYVSWHISHPAYPASNKFREGCTSYDVKAIESSKNVGNSVASHWLIVSLTLLEGWEGFGVRPERFFVDFNTSFNFNTYPIIESRVSSRA